MTFQETLFKSKDKRCVQKNSHTKDGRLYLRLDQQYIHMSYDISKVIGGKL